MSPRLSMVIPLGLLLGLSGCGKKEATAGATQTGGSAQPAASEKAAAAFQKPLVEGLKKAGLSVGELEPTAAKPYQARSCARGEVSKLDLMACQYESEQSAEQAKASLRQFLAGAGTGAVRRTGAVLLAVADRAKIDPRGLLVDKTLKTFAGLTLR